MKAQKRKKRRRKPRMPPKWEEVVGKLVSIKSMPVMKLKFNLLKKRLKLILQSTWRSIIGHLVVKIFSINSREGLKSHFAKKSWMSSLRPKF
jgi:hypothetical protein